MRRVQRVHFVHWMKATVRYFYLDDDGDATPVARQHSRWPAAGGESSRTPRYLGAVGESISRTPRYSGGGGGGERTPVVGLPHQQQLQSLTEQDEELDLRESMNRQERQPIKSVVRKVGQPITGLV